MFKNYIKTAWRNIKRQKGYSSINIAGLALGMACSILIVFYIHHELSFDRFHENADRIYRVVVDATLPQNRITVPAAQTALGRTLAKDFPEVAAAVRVQSRPKTFVKYADRTFYESASSMPTRRSSTSSRFRSSPEIRRPPSPGPTPSS